MICSGLVLINPNGDELPDGVEDGVVSKRKLEIRHFLGAFRGLGRTLDSLPEEEAKVIDTLVGMDDFYAYFCCSHPLVRPMLLDLLPPRDEPLRHLLHAHEADGDPHLGGPVLLRTQVGK